MPSVTILVGPPGSGKSTWRAANLPAMVDPVVISSDDLIEKMAAERDLTYSEIFDEVVAECDRESYQQFTDAVKLRRDIVVDRTNMSRKSRRRYLSQLPKNYVRNVVVFQIERPELDQRLEQRRRATGKWIPAEVIDQMLANYEEPSEEENFANIVFVSAKN